MSWNQPIETISTLTVGRCGVETLSDGAFFYCLDGERVQWAHSRAESEDGRRINTRTAAMGEPSVTETRDELGAGQTVTVTFAENGLKLHRAVTAYTDRPWIAVRCTLEDEGGETATRFIAPIDTPYPDRTGKPLLLSLDQKILKVPYDNDMWVRYASVPPYPGCTSYDLAAIYDEETREGLIIGAIDFDVWKNAVACSAIDARSVTAFSGVADAGTHDAEPHGCVRGQTVASARFVMCWWADIRTGLEDFGGLCAAVRAPLPWDGPVPFGFNTYSGLGGHLTLEAWQKAGDLIHADLPSFCDADGVTYINLDGHFGLDEDRIAQMVKDFHARGQKVGTYYAPFVAHRRLNLDRHPEGSPEVTFADLLLRDRMGRPLHSPDGLSALDVTHPAWEKHIRTVIRGIAAAGFDYLKIDFLSHAAMEGVHADPACLTGRMALDHGYRVIADELAQADHPIFLSLSIAPLFPHGWGHARRCCCDSFGHTEDNRYVLNALNFAWWTNGRLYAFNDPDHIALYNSAIDGRGPTTPEEARSRYNAAAISGTVMLLSDDYGPNGDAALHAASEARARAFADQAEVNAVARRRKAFVPVELRDGTAAVYVSTEADGTYAAFFNYSREPQAITVQARRAGLPLNGTVRDLNRGTAWSYDSTLTVALAPMDSALLKWGEAPQKL